MNIRPILSVISTVTDILDTVLTGSNSNIVQRKRYTLQGVSGNICFSSVGNRIIVSNLSDKPIGLSFPRQNEVEGSRLILKPNVNTDVTEIMTEHARRCSTSFELSYVDNSVADTNAEEQVCMAFGDINLDIDGSVYLGDGLSAEVVPNYLIISAWSPVYLKGIYLLEIKKEGKTINLFQNIFFPDAENGHSQMFFPINFDIQTMSTNIIQIEVKALCIYV